MPSTSLVTVPDRSTDSTSYTYLPAVIDPVVAAFIDNATTPSEVSVTPNANDVDDEYDFLS
jgi:hypothetical protein